MFSRKKDAQSKNPPTPPWLTWGVIIFILLALTLNVMGITPQAPPSSRPGSSTASTAATQTNWNMFSLETYKSRVMPGYGQLQISDIKPGTGSMVLCGQKVSMRYHEIQLEPGKGQFDEKKLPMQEMEFRLGDSGVGEALQTGVLGMRVGGTRSVVVPKERTLNRATPVRYMVEVSKAEPEFIPPEKERMPLRTFERRVGNLQEATCGDTVKVHLMIWDMAGETLFNTHSLNKGEPLTIRLGDVPLMVGIQLGMQGMQIDASRTLLVPPYLQHPLPGVIKLVAAPPEEAGKPALEGAKLTPDQDSAVQPAELLRNLKLPDNQVIIVDIELIP